MNRFLCILATLLFVCAALAAPAPESFVSGWGKPIDPDKDCKIRRDKGVITFEMPGTDHDYAPHRKRVNAPRLLRDLEGDFEIRVRVRIDCRPSVKSTVKDQPSYVSAGFLIIPPDTFFAKCVRLEYRVEGQGDGSDGCLVAMVRNNEGKGRGGVMGYKPLGWPFKGTPDYVYLRLERYGEIISYTISSDGISWIQSRGIGGISGLPSKLKVGLVASSASIDPSKVNFDQLKLTQGNKKRQRWEFMSDWDAPVDADKDCKIQRDKDTLTIEMPGSDHDYDPIRKRFNAPRLISQLEGDFDLEVRVRIDSRPSPHSTVKGQPSFVSAGFLIIYPEKENAICDRLEYAVSQQGSNPDSYAVAPQLAKPRRENPVPKGKDAGSYAVMKTWTGALQRKGKGIEWDHGKPKQLTNILWERGWQNWPLLEKSDYVYLRLDYRVGGWACCYISPDGEKWTRLGYLSHVPAKGKIGLASYSTSSDRAKVRFDQLKLAWDKKKSK